jgi:hypothetical protein
MVVASVLELSAQLPVYKPVAAIALAAGVGAVIGLVYGCGQMVRETRLAVQYLEEEAPI